MRESVQDVVVLVPGILGSRLERRGRPIWGTAGSMVRALVAPNSTLGLRDTDGATAEPGVAATGLVGAAGQYPGLVKIGPYRALLDNLHHRLALDRDNLVVFPYDWRLSNAYNATRLEAAVYPVLDRRRRAFPEAELVFVCHSMGGLLVQHFTDRLGHGPDTRRVVTFGTPFRGAARALGVMAHGWPPRLAVIRARFRDHARALPSVHELLPHYRAIADGTQLRSPTPRDLADITDPAHLDRARALHQELDTPGPRPYHRTVVVGTEQTTPQFVEMAGDGQVRLHTSWLGPDDEVIDRGGDGTVPRQSVTPPEWDDDADAIPHAQSHVALPTASGAARVVCNAVTARERATQAPAGPRIRLDVPDILEAGSALEVQATADDQELPVVVTVEDVSTGRQITTPRSPRSPASRGHPTVSFSPLPAGHYRVRAEPAIRAPHIAAVWDLTAVIDPATIPDRDSPPGR